MVDKRITELTPLTGANLADSDEFPVVDASASETKSITKVELVTALGQSFVSQADASLDAIAATIAKTAVDVLVYKTAYDSDGGAWTERTQNTSWYRASGKHPAATVAVLEAGTLTIYDATDTSLPVWRTEDLSSFTCNKVTARDGKYLVATTTGLIVLDYITDDIEAVLTYSTSTTPAIVNNVVNDAAITVLDDANINPTTGLPFVTIVVATDGGVSVIKEEDGTSADITTTGQDSVAFTSDRRLVFGSSTGGLQIGPIPSADFAGVSLWRDYFINTSSSPALLELSSDALATGDVVALGHSVGLTTVYENVATPAEGAVAYITSDYNTGYMQGDIELSLCDGLTDRSVTGTTVTDNGTAVVSAAATGAEQKKITATGGTITAPVTTGGAIYGWEYISGVPAFRAGTGWVGVSEAGGTLTIADGTTFSMMRYTNGSGPSAAQYVFQEEKEKFTLQENTACLLYGTSDAVTALDHDPVTDLLHVGTGDGRSDFQGLVRVNNTTNAVGAAISAVDGLIADE